jgi:2-polyprenyl-3-methyl-5-hydroxy-6-metoxy-1,4-benzoquinol methylase
METNCTNPTGKDLGEFEYDVFVSHSHSDNDKVTRVVDRLHSAGLNVCIDLRWPTGTDIPIAVERGLERSRCLLFCMSRAAFESEWMSLERSTVLFRDPSSQQRRLIPLLLEECERPGTIARLTHIDGRNLDEKVLEKVVAACRYNTSVAPSDGAPRRHLFTIGDYVVPYIPILNDPVRSDSFSFLSRRDLSVDRDLISYSLPDAFAGTKLPYRFDNDPARAWCCRLSSYELRGRKPLAVRFSPTLYEDYLISSEYLDDPIPMDPTRSFRGEFGGIGLNDQDLRPFQLTNICGVGVFVISSDGWLFSTSQPADAHVYPGRKTFSSSGTLRWGARPDPFCWTLYKAADEINHQIDLDKLQLVSFGADARKLYFQFSFVERSQESAERIGDRLRSRRLAQQIPFELPQVVRELVRGRWEPAAEAAILTLCAKTFGIDQLRTQLSGLRREVVERRGMLEEWDYRASCTGVLPDTTVRYPRSSREAGSERYADWVFDCIKDCVAGRDVLEVGCGTGRITKRLVDAHARKLTCVDISEKMLEKNRARLGDVGVGLVDYICEFAQDYRYGMHQVVVCSLVLVHNVPHESFMNLVKGICSYCEDWLLVFEDISTGRVTGPSTRIRTRQELEDSFRAHGFEVVDAKEYRLFEDTILFLAMRRLREDLPRPSPGRHPAAERSCTRE